MSEPVIQSIPLNQLELSPANVRKTSAGKTAFAELKASIAAHGLLENLVARAIEPGPNGDRPLRRNRRRPPFDRAHRPGPRGHALNRLPRALPRGRRRYRARRASCL